MHQTRRPDELCVGLGVVKQVGKVRVRGFVPDTNKIIGESESVCPIIIVKIDGGQVFKYWPVCREVRRSVCRVIRTAL
ncbi:hypothetical protein [Rubripirellula amarantea]|uniref:hypothetical protein n=1 Tax=Rubripirellula amarantea TaxID=2527999 RepID=UPI0013EF10BF|nr:hypothetical protein [Rubripirellula amarantea]